MDTNLSELLFKLSRLKWEKTSPFDNEAGQLTILQMKTLGFLAHKQRVQMRDIAAYFQIEMPSATSLINGLFKRGLVEREADSQDRRIVRIVLTTQGENVVKKMTEHSEKKAHAFLGYLSPGDKQTFTRILETIVTKMEEEYKK